MLGAYARAGKRLADGAPKVGTVPEEERDARSVPAPVTMPTNSGNQEPFVKRFEMAVMQYVILAKARQGEVTKENLKQTFRGNLQMSEDHFDHCLNILVKDEHLKEAGGGKYTITDDGREDIQKLQHLVLELPNVVQQGGSQQQRTGATQTQASGSGGGGSTGSTVGNQGSFGSSKAQGRDAGTQTGSSYPGSSSGQSGVSGQQKTGDVNKGGATSTRDR